MVKVFVSAAEPSGYNIGAQIIQHFQSKAEVQFLGGGKMQSCGGSSIQDSDTLSVMGFWDVLPRLLNIYRLGNNVVDFIQRWQPDLIITIDSFGFHRRVVEKLQHLRPHTKFCHFVSPQIWAHRAHRKHMVAKLYDQLCCLMPFEPQLYHGLDIKVDYIGHPAFYLTELDPHSTKPYTLLMLGSRVHEIKRLLPIFAALANKLTAAGKSPLVLTLPAFLPWLAEAFHGIAHVTTDRSMLYSVEKAVVKSGTSSQELVAMGIPHIVCFKTNPLTFLCAKYMLKTPYITIGNIVMHDMVIPELIQNFTANDLYDALETLNIEEQKTAFKQIKNIFAHNIKDWQDIMAELLQ